ncbi:TPA: Vi polysaccharide biosynthesis protein VipA/TviB, partial [Candidatus Peribacteria bacterium]|nr:Vi polysaccharide biosynthesis protein VipA/TviB [Candidatus Peribacteria bacterium]
MGYVGLPLAHAFALRGKRVIGYDIDDGRIDELNRNIDRTSELSEDQLKEVTIEFSFDPTVLGDSDVIIVALPTPIDENNKPDIAILKAGTETVGKNMKDGAIIVFESTVYPGATEEFCVPILSQQSKLNYIHEGNKNNQSEGFYCGYSPERINPGDKKHSLTNITKITAGSNAEIAGIVDELYNSILYGGTHKVSSIAVAEAAKVIENIQRDVNIALI